ncbi:MAG: hypothetical protein HN396_16865 [Gemmatimonadales bacterium]|jgi:hypothetical protein|nr:hypothetical protein [Gemmatimonadales bacterium]
MSDVLYIHPGCGCREYDETPQAECRACGETFIPEVNYGEPYRFCPLCGVEFTLCRWRRCVDRMWQLGSGIADWHQKRRTGWQMECRSTMFDVVGDWRVDRSWDEYGEWNTPDRERIVRFLGEGRDNGPSTKLTRVGQYVQISDDWGEYRFYFVGTHRKLPG